MFRLFAIRLRRLLAILLLAPTVAFAADEQIGAFLLIDGEQDVIALVGEISINSPLDFRRSMQKRPNATTLILASPGGLVASGLIIAQDVHARGLHTYIPPESGCYSACAYIFLAGAQRVADGELGVHQMAAETQDNSGIQVTVSEMLDTLLEFDTPREVISRMLRTPNEEMYVFSRQEVQELGINRTAEIPASPGGPAVTPTAPGTPVSPQVHKPALPVVPPVQSGIRLAIYEGLDFYGQDLSSGHAENLVECTRACIGDNLCRAFTFNANPEIKTGPNCFLKSGTGRLEGYDDAISGLLMGAADGDAPDFTFGAIDPTRDVSTATRLTGQDLDVPSGRNIKSLGECRQTCTTLDQCEAFTYRASTKQCLLKSGVGGQFSAKGYTSGTKRYVTIRATDVITVDE